LTTKIVGPLKGTIEVESEPGVGSVFTIILPFGAEGRA
jgi:signal transduction histidine kinase